MFQKILYTIRKDSTHTLLYKLFLYWVRIEPSPPPPPPAPPSERLGMATARVVIHHRESRFQLTAGKVVISSQYIDRVQQKRAGKPLGSIIENKLCKSTGTFFFFAHLCARLGVAFLRVFYTKKKFGWPAFLRERKKERKEGRKEIHLGKEKKKGAGCA